MTRRRPDQTSSIAHTLLSTSPVGRATSRTTSSVTSVTTLDERFGQAIQRPPAWASLGRSEAIFRYKNRALVVEDIEGGNGVFLRVRRPVELEPGDEFIVGDQLLRVEKNPTADDEPDPEPTYFYSSPKWPSSFRVVQIFEGGHFSIVLDQSSTVCCHEKLKQA